MKNKALAADDLQESIVSGVIVAWCHHTALPEPQGWHLAASGALHTKYSSVRVVQQRLRQLCQPPTVVQETMLLRASTAPLVPHTTVSASTVTLHCSLNSPILRTPWGPLHMCRLHEPAGVHAREDSVALLSSSAVH